MIARLQIGAKLTRIADGTEKQRSSPQAERLGRRESSGDERSVTPKDERITTPAKASNVLLAAAGMDAWIGLTVGTTDKMGQPAE